MLRRNNQYLLSTPNKLETKKKGAPEKPFDQSGSVQVMSKSIGVLLQESEDDMSVRIDSDEEDSLRIIEEADSETSNSQSQREIDDEDDFDSILINEYLEEHNSEDGCVKYHDIYIRAKLKDQKLFILL